jgi:hypothetical protein
LLLQIQGGCVERWIDLWSAVLGCTIRPRTMAAVPITRGCYDRRVAELRGQLGLLQQQCRQGGLSEELEDLLQQQIRCAHAYLWALYAEMEDD